MYRNRALLAAPPDDTPEKAHAIRSLQAHEVGHQWFGDLVTQATWDDVWLSEGFATWFSAKVMDQEQPPARKHLASVAARERIMAVDASTRTRPVRLPMTSREDTKGVYSQIVYQKGGAILLMLDGWLGEERVQKGLQLYLKDHAYGAAATDDLAAALRRGSGTDPKAVMHSFLDQIGIPTVSARAQCESGKQVKVLLEQTNPSRTWTIPVCWSAEGARPGCTVLDGPQREVTLAASATCPAWIYPNAGGTGYYRSEWSAPQLAALAASGLEKLSAPERLTLAYDIRAQQKAGRLDAAAGQAILEKLASDPVPEVSNAAKGAPPQGRERD